jgi:uridine kinase
MQFYSKNFNHYKKIILSKLFISGLIFKIFISFFFASNFLKDLFIPFIDFFAKNHYANPYQEFFISGKPNAFPYPAMMLYIMSLPNIILGSLYDWRPILFSRIPLLFADLIIFFTLINLIKNNEKKVLIYYWLSPVLIYINYIHGQLDVIPISIFFISLYLLFCKKFELSSLLLGICIATKTNMIISLPFYLIYLIYYKKIKFSRFLSNIAIVVIVFVTINLKYISDEYFVEMVFNNQEQSKIFNLYYSFQNGNLLYIAVLSYIFLLITFLNFKNVSKDVYIMFLGFGFGIITLMVSPMQGWYYWILPFFIYFICKTTNPKINILLLLFFSLQLAYFLYFLINPDSKNYEILNLSNGDIYKLPKLYYYLEEIGFNVGLMSNIIFTILQTLLFANCFFVYKIGIINFLNHKLLSDKFILGLCGDSGAGKTTISNAIKMIFKEDNTTIIRGDDMHKWERGDENWKSLTHLNPKSNFLYNEVTQLKAIKSGVSIKRRVYNHDTGKFNEEVKFNPKNLVIFEGLHSFYLKQMRDLQDLKIFIKPSEDLRKNWKVSRDKIKRGYSEKKVLQQIDERKIDSQKFINSQMEYADILIEIISEFLDKSFENVNSLKITINNSFNIEPVFVELLKIETMNCFHEYESSDKQIIVINGEISDKNLYKIFGNLKLNQELYDFGVSNPIFEKDYLGIIQLFIAYCIMSNIN